jgi:maltose/moltooligosaccharide transporter
MNKQKLSFWQIWNMSFGFLGIQFGFALQGGFMSRIFQTLGASSDEIPMLWIAAPLTGLIVQPIIGYLSDNTWHHRFGRRRPYFLIGAILSSITLFFIPYSSTLWIAAGLLWVLDASINISMEPFRALVADKLDDTQRSYGFMVQTLVIGIGTWIASNLPWFISYIGFSDSASIGIVPMSVKIAFAIGALVFLSSIIYTVFTTTEYPPRNIEEFKNKSKNSNFLKEIMSNIISMPKTMKKLGIIQFFSWFAFFTMWSMSNPALTEHVYNSPMPIQSDFNLNTNDLEDISSYDYANTKFQIASNSVGSAMGMYGLSSMLFALVLTFYTSKKKINRKNIHMFSLLIGGLGFIMMYFIKGQPELLIYCFVLIGISWGSILSMPYAMLSSSVDPEKMGITIGIFNMFIVIPQIIAAIGGINFVSNIIGDEPINSMIIAGLSLIIAGFANLLITNEKAIS